FWFTVKTLGAGGRGALGDRTMRVAAHLEREVARQDCFEPFRSKVELASVCFRYLPPWARLLGAEERARPSAQRRLNRAQVALQRAVESGGYAWFPAIVLEGAVYFRFGVFNYQTSEKDVDDVLAHIRRLAASTSG